MRECCWLADPAVMHCHMHGRCVQVWQTELSRLVEHSNPACSALTLAYLHWTMSAVRTNAWKQVKLLADMNAPADFPAVDCCCCCVHYCQYCNTSRPIRDAQIRLLSREHLTCTYLAHHEPESVRIVTPVYSCSQRKFSDIRHCTCSGLWE